MGTTSVPHVFDTIPAARILSVTLGTKQIYVTIIQKAVQHAGKVTSSCLHNVKSRLLTFSLSLAPPLQSVINICVRRCWKLCLDANISGNNIVWTILSEAQGWL